MRGWGLVIETAGTSLQLGLLKDGEPHSGIRWDGKNQHGEKLIPFAMQLLHENHLQWGDIRYAVYHQGPGSHTGLRIGLSAVKAWALSLKWDVYAVPLMRVLYEVARQRGIAEKVFTFWEARKGEWYGQLWEAEKPTTPPTLLPSATWIHSAREYLWVGNAFEAHFYIHEISWLMVAAAARHLTPICRMEELITLTPLYFREFIPTQRRK